MKTILLYAVPPVIGAAIGFVTNVIAIKMLFRPLREIRVFGIRLPFTPGILPRQRGELAQSIGSMVERELFTPDILRQRLDREDVRAKIKGMVSELTGKVLSSAPGSLLGEENGFFLDRVEQKAQEQYPAAASALVNYLRRPEIHREMESRGHVFLRAAIMKLNVFQRFFISVAQYDSTLSRQMPLIIDDLIDTIGSLLEDPAIKNKLLSAVKNYLQGLLGNREKSIGEILGVGNDDKQKMDEYLSGKLLSVLNEQIEKLLETINVKNMVSERIDSLDMIRVERIILDVMANNFKWIDIFGAILGFFIGSVQVFLSTVLR
jgi:uncharacterized membrane protein YheB (UPF0754 family)